MIAGDGLCDERAVRVLCDEGPRYTRELIEWGARFNRGADGEPALASEGAHTVRRVLHAADATGREIGRVLWDRISTVARIRVLKNTLAVSAIIEDGRCLGVRFIDAQGEPGRAYGRATLLATGGAGQVFAETTNPEVATGDGVALAYRAGARIADMEFVQFHPTVLEVEGAPRFLLSEALRGEGARLVDASGEPFMLRYHPAADLAPRDVVARSIVLESRRTSGPIFLSLRHLDADEVHGRFPTIAATCLKAGFDLARDLIPVGPAAHYMMGGIETDLDGRSSVSGLFAAGEVACTRVHGANRLASNSLLEGLVFGARSGRAMLGVPRDAELPPPVFRDTAGHRAEPRDARNERGRHPPVDVEIGRPVPRSGEPARRLQLASGTVRRTRRSPCRPCCARPRRMAAGEHRDRRVAHRAGGARARREPRRALPHRLSFPRRSKMESSYLRHRPT